MKYEKLETANVIAHFDEEDSVLRITYIGQVTPDVTESVYSWIGRLIVSSGGNVGLARGSIYDFRQVTDFVNRNLSTAQRESSQLSRKVDVSNHPVALLVDTFYQEQFVRLSMKVSKQDNRKRIVHSEADALTYIDEFHLKLTPQT
jgi:hypothetical protein